MKKLFAILSALVLLASQKINAQVLSQVTLHDGTNTISLPGNASLEFNFKGHYFSNYIFHDAAGTAHPLKTARGIVNGVPAPACGGDEVRVASYQKDIGVYICMAKYTPTIVYTEFDMTIDMPTATGKAQNRRVEVKLVK